MQVTDKTYRIFYDSETTIIYFQGSLRLGGMEEYAPIVALLEQVSQEHPDTITLDLSQLEFLNSSGISMLSKFVINVRKNGKSNLKIKGSNQIPWQGKSLKNLQRLMPNLVLELN